MPLKLQIFTPEKEIYNEEVNEVVIPTIDGVIGVLPHHAPIVSQIAPGAVLIKKSGNTTPLAVYGGFVTVENNVVSLLADYAAHVEDIELAKAEEAKERAEKVMREKLSNEDYVIASAELQKAIMQIRLVRKYRHN